MKNYWVSNNIFSRPRVITHSVTKVIINVFVYPEKTIMMPFKKNVEK